MLGGGPPTHRQPLSWFVWAFLLVAVALVGLGVRSEVSVARYCLFLAGGTMGVFAALLLLANYING